MKNKLLYSPWLFVVVFVITATIMTIYEVIKEMIFKGALTSWQSHSITIIVTAVIAIFTASVMRSWVLAISLKEKEIEYREQSLVSFSLILSAVNHIVNNVLNYLQLVRVEIDKDGTLQEETLQLLEASIEDANKQMKILNEIQNPNKLESYKGIFP